MITPVLAEVSLTVCHFEDAPVLRHCIWLAALWSHGDRGWETSRPGMTPEETGQLLLTYSDDDGRSWASLRNITGMVKNPAWRLCFRPEKWHLRYDARRGAGYSCLAPAGPDHLGVVYEGQCELYYMRIPLADRLQ